MPISPLPWHVEGARIVDANGQPVATCHLDLPVVLVMDKPVMGLENAAAIAHTMSSISNLVDAATAALTAGAEMTPEYYARLEAALLPFEHLVPPERRFLLGTQPVAPAYAVLTPEVLQDAYDVTVRASEERLRALRPPVAPARLVEAVADRCTSCDGYGRTEFDICEDCNGQGRTSTGSPEVTICDNCDGTGGNPRSRLPPHLK